MVPKKINVADAATQIEEYWSPHIVAELNGQHVRLAKLKGEFVWHSHEDEDEMFLVVSGKLCIEFRGGKVMLGEGELITIPKGVEHKPVAEEEVLVLLFEPAETINTGSTSESELTKKQLNRL